MSRSASTAPPDGAPLLLIRIDQALPAHVRTTRAQLSHATSGSAGRLPSGQVTMPEPIAPPPTTGNLAAVAAPTQTHPRDPAAFTAALLAVTVVTGLIDATSVLTLGHVFVANMTGNVIFIGLALTGAAGFSPWRSVCAFLGFAAGAILGGSADRPSRRWRVLSRCAAGCFALFVVAGVTEAATSAHPGNVAVVIILLSTATAMGLQNGTVRRLSSTRRTNVVTTTTAVIAADLRQGNLRAAGSQAGSILCLVAGGVVGALLIHCANALAPLIVASVVLAVVSAVAFLIDRSQPRPAA